MFGKNPNLFPETACLDINTAQHGHTNHNRTLLHFLEHFGTEMMLNLIMCFCAQGATLDWAQVCTLGSLTLQNRIKVKIKAVFKPNQVVH